MSVRVALFRDSLWKSGRSIPRVVHQNTLDFEDFITYTAKTCGGQTANIRAVIMQVTEALQDQLSSGNQVRTPMGTFSLGVHSPQIPESQSATEILPRINADSLTLSLRPNKDIIDTLRRMANLEIVDRPAVQLPIIHAIQNAEDPSFINQASVGQIVNIVGSRLSFDKADLETGVFLINQDNDEEIRASVYSRLGSSRVDCKIPLASAGNYTVELRTRTRDGGELRTGVFETEFALV